MATKRKQIYYYEMKPLLLSLLLNLVDLVNSQTIPNLNHSSIHQTNNQPFHPQTAPPYQDSRAIASLPNNQQQKSNEYIDKLQSWLSSSSQSTPPTQAGEISRGHQVNDEISLPANELSSKRLVSMTSYLQPTNNFYIAAQKQQQLLKYRDDCSTGLLTFELTTGFIYKPTAAETLAMIPSTLQLPECLNTCLKNSSCLAINFEMGLCVLLSSSAKHNPANLQTSQFPVFTFYAEKKCLFSGK